MNHKHVEACAKPQVACTVERDQSGGRLGSEVRAGGCGRDVQQKSEENQKERRMKRTDGVVGECDSPESHEDDGETHQSNGVDRQAPAKRRSSTLTSPPRKREAERGRT